MYASNDLDCVVERSAHKWAAQGNVSAGVCSLCGGGEGSCAAT
jgi:hypothetical protein